MASPAPLQRRMSATEEIMEKNGPRAQRREKALDDRAKEEARLEKRVSDERLIQKQALRAKADKRLESPPRKLEATPPRDPQCPLVCLVCRWTAKNAGGSCTCNSPPAAVLRQFAPQCTPTARSSPSSSGSLSRGTPQMQRQGSLSDHILYSPSPSSSIPSGRQTQRQGSLSDHNVYSPSPSGSSPRSTPHMQRQGSLSDHILYSAPSCEPQSAELPASPLRRPLS